LLPCADIAGAFLTRSAAKPTRPACFSDEHFTVDGTLLEAWASLKSFRRKDAGPTPPPDDPGQPDREFPRRARAERDPSLHDGPRRPARAERPGEEAKLSYAGHVLLDNRYGLVANVCVTHATGTAEREAALLLLGAVADGGTVGGDKGFDVPSFVAGVRALGVTPHVAQKIKGTAIDARTTRHAGMPSANGNGN